MITWYIYIYIYTYYPYLRALDHPGTRHRPFALIGYIAISTLHLVSWMYIISRPKRRPKHFSEQDAYTNRQIDHPDRTPNATTFYLQLLHPL